MQAPRILPHHWTAWRCAPADGPTNMAWDQALLESVRTDRLVWRWYQWDRPTVSFGRNERTAGRFDQDSVEAAGLAAVRRPTGGRALLHARELTYSVTCPLPRETPWGAAYAAINAVLLATLQRAGIPALAAVGAPAMAPDGPVCFDAPAPGEIVVQGRKLVGSAVWRQGDGYLQHGSILLADDQSRLADAARAPVPPAPPAASLDQLMPDQTDDARIASILGAWHQVVGSVEEYRPSAEIQDVMRRHRQQIASPLWLWRR